MTGWMPMTIEELERRLYRLPEKERWHWKVVEKPRRHLLLLDAQGGLYDFKLQGGLAIRKTAVTKPCANPAVTQ